MNFETFFNHKFLQRPEPPISQSPLQTVDLPLPNIYGCSPRTTNIVPIRSATPVKNTPPTSQPGKVIIIIVFHLFFNYFLFQNHRDLRELHLVQVRKMILFQFRRIYLQIILAKVSETNGNNQKTYCLFVSLFLFLYQQL